MRTRPPDPVWRLLVLLSATVAPCATAALLVAMALSGAGVVPVVVVAAAAAVLHVAAWRADPRPVGAFVAAAGAMAVLALVPMPGWSSGVWLPSSACYLLAAWRLVVAGPRPWVGRVLAVGVAGVALTAGAAAVRAPGDAGGGAAGGGTWSAWLPVLEAALLLAAVVAVWGFARAARAQRERAAADAAERLERARRSERAEIRRDLHDVIAHSLTLVVAQAEAARVGTREPATAQALAQVADTARSALLGLRGMLRVLDAAPAVAGDVVPSLDGLPALVAAAATPLHVVTLTEHGERRALPADAESALVRLVQEGLTNALRHVAPPLTVEVHVDWDAERDADAVRVRVSDDGGAGPRAADDAGVRAGTGSGLAAAERRVTAAGGTLDVERGGTDASGWTLSARLPTVGAA
ncbi:histidine kinase [Cellulomonas iranensis]|uniref:sensor histidine kinase n=2 Tax=Cellulomonas iranensis TaxID=76862 RepID=UPI001CF1926D|nr:histidine kinase [Cellulomonas iranensis]UCN14351.1 histidine kinase [Cellulomonas iranensis]